MGEKTFDGIRVKKPSINPNHHKLGTNKTWVMNLILLHQFFGLILIIPFVVLRSCF